MTLSRLIAWFGSGFFVFAASLALAGGQYPAGDITFYNASNKTVTAQVSSFGKINISAKEEKTIHYSTLSAACSGHARACKADFYVDNTHAGSATINVETGKLVRVNLTMKVHTTHGPQQVLRSVVIQ